MKQHIGVRDLPLRDMISLGAWRMGLGCSGKILPSPSPSPPSSSPTRGWGGPRICFFPKSNHKNAPPGAFVRFDFGKSRILAPPPNPGRVTAAATEEFSQSIQAPSSTHPGTTYPVRATPLSDCSICFNLLQHVRFLIYVSRCLRLA